MAGADPTHLAPRRARIAAACINVAPALIPLVTWLASTAAGSEPGYGVLGFWAWSMAALLIVMSLNTLLLLWRRQSLGLAYVGLEYEGASAGRMLLGKIVVWGLPLLTVPTIALPVVGLSNWLAWLGPERRTLTDRFGGCRVVERPDARQASALLELLMLGPLLVFFPLYGQLRGGVFGGAFALLLVLGAMAWQRRESARK